MSIDLFEMVADRKLTPTEAADIIMLERRLSRPWWIAFLLWLMGEA